MTRQSLVAGCLSAILCVTLAVILSLPAHAEAITVGGRNYDSLEAFLEGSWTWLRRDPPQIVRLRFGQDRSFSFNNETIKLTHEGSFKGTGDGVEFVITRSCDTKECVDRAPPMVVNYQLRPETPNRFYSADEEWNRDP